MEVPTKRYKFTAVTESGKTIELVNINPENNTGTYRNEMGKLKYVKLDDVAITMSDSKIN